VRPKQSQAHQAREDVAAARAGWSERQVADEPRAGRFDGVSPARDLAGGPIVHHHDVAGRERGASTCAA